MKTDATLRFFLVLSEVSKRITGAGSGVAKAADDAVADPKPATFAAAQEELARVDDQLRDQILQEVHQQMTRDISAIWDSMPFATRTNRPN